MTKAAGPYNATVWVKDVREAASEGMAALYLALIPPVAMAAAGAYCAYFAATNGQNNWAVAFAGSAVLTMAFAVCSEGQRRAHGPAILLKMVTWGASSLRIGIFGADALLALLDPSLDPMGLSSRVAAGYDLWAKYLGLDCAPCLQAIDAAGLVELVVLLLRYPFRSQAKQERPSQYRVKPGEEALSNVLLFVILGGVFAYGAQWTTSRWGDDPVGNFAWGLVGGIGAIYLAVLVVLAALFVLVMVGIAAAGAAVGAIPGVLLGALLGALSDGLPGLLQGAKVGASLGALAGALIAFSLLDS